ncbi:hypothetical protein [Neochlamydia sp. S13]|uniref:hypothetical protein n=1 Tax=Neochlamydia sp. S13 TaxID=1353976 RepID=UPI0013152B6D|nr:hypothetical protein [Neochlamydia sp. S13]
MKKFLKAPKFNLIRYTLQEARRLGIDAHTSIKQCWSYWLEWSNWHHKHQARTCY